MKRTLRAPTAALIVSAALFSSSTAAAEDMLVGVDGGLVLPLGDWSEVSGLGFGALGRFEYAMDSSLSATGRVGYITHLKKNDHYKTSELPILAGLRLGLSGQPDGLYVAGEAGLVNFTFQRPVAGAVFGNQAGGDEVRSDSELKFGITGGAGYRSGDVDGRAGLIIVSVGDLEETFGLMVTVGYNFTRF